MAGLSFHLVPVGQDQIHHLQLITSNTTETKYLQKDIEICQKGYELSRRFVDFLVPLSLSVHGPRSTVSSVHWRCEVFCVLSELLLRVCLQHLLDGTCPIIRWSGRFRGENCVTAVSHVRIISRAIAVCRLSIHSLSCQCWEIVSETASHAGLTTVKRCTIEQMWA